MPHADLFQMLVSIPNAPREGLWDHIPKLLGELERHGVRIQGTRTELVKGGRKQYLGRLCERGRHHLQNAKRVSLRYQNYVAIPYTLAAHGNRVRDFFHDAYYAAFFAARWALVSNGQYDCSQHKEMSKALKQRFTAPPMQNRAQKTAQVLEQLQEFRNDADYIMNTEKLGALASPQMMQAELAGVSDLYTVWGIP